MSNQNCHFCICWNSLLALFYTRLGFLWNVNHCRLLGIVAVSFVLDFVVVLVVALAEHIMQSICVRHLLRINAYFFVKSMSTLTNYTLKRLNIQGAFFANSTKLLLRL